MEDRISNHFQHHNLTGVVTFKSERRDRIELFTKTCLDAFGEVVGMFLPDLPDHHVAYEYPLRDTSDQVRLRRIAEKMGFNNFESIQPSRANVLDFSTRCWGHNYNLLEINKEKKTVRLAVWSHHPPQVGTHLILNTDTGTTRYRATHVEHASGVDDMTFVDAVFDPRKPEEVKTYAL